VYGDLHGGQARGVASHRRGAAHAQAMVELVDTCPVHVPGLEKAFRFKNSGVSEEGGVKWVEPLRWPQLA